jgi:acetylglutamate kinase
MESELLDIVEGLFLSKMKEETTNNSLRAMDIGALIIVGTFACTNQGKMMVINLDQLAPYEGTTQDEWP